MLKIKAIKNNSSIYEYLYLFFVKSRPVQVSR
ncbi:MAG: hypothetical protein ACI9WV_002589, partial [Patiriisocius sp.]